MVSIIAAVAQNGMIGGDNRLIWHISEDLKRFKAITSGHPVVMGRRTFESLGRPLPGRTNVVVSRNPHYRAEGVLLADSPGEAVGMFPADEEVFIIGGAELYRQTLPFADRLYLTEVCHDYKGDTSFPAWDPREWESVFEVCYERGVDFPYPFVFRDYVRRKK
jgi:dihydrofolate reductase